MITTILPTNRPTAIQLREYQKVMVARLYDVIRRGCLRILMIAVMGSGKTIISSWVMRDAVSKGRRCVFLVGLNVLLDQTAKTLQNLGVPCTVLQGDRPVDEAAPVLIVSLQTVSSRLRRGKNLGSLLGCVDLILVDEAHVTAFHDAYSEIEAFYPAAIKIGLTATPWRLNKREWLGMRFDAVVEGPQPPDIIKLGGALSCRCFTLTGAIDLETLRVRNGDFVDSDIADQACRDEALNHVVNETLRLCFDRSALMVGATVHQARLMCDYYNQRGIPAEVIVGSTPQREREAIFERVRQGITKVICSVGCLTAGFDLPAISAIIYVRATKSRALFQQTAGRGSRPYPGKENYLLLDFGGNLKRFGNPMSVQNYDISQPQQEEPQVMSKTCPECSAEVKIFVQVCPHCGYEFAGNEPEPEQQEELILSQLNEFTDALTREKIKSLRRWKKQVYEANVSPDEAIDSFVSVYGHNPPGEWMQHACLSKRYSQNRKAEFINYLFQHCNRQNKWSRQWVAYHMTLEFGEFNPTIVNWWEILEVDRNASWETVKAAYIAKAEELHPDQVVAGCEAMLEQLNLALADAKEGVAA